MSSERDTQQKCVLLGAGGHAKVVLSVARASGLQVVGVCDKKLVDEHVTNWRGLPVLGGDEALDRYDPDTVSLINGVGQVVGGRARQNVYERLRKKGFRFPVLVHPAAMCDPDAQLAEGVQVMAGAVLQPDCRIGENSIVNTRASVDHDCIVGAHVHIAPGATVCGGVRIDDGAFVGSGATIIQLLHVGAYAVVGAGTTLVRDVAPGEKTAARAAKV